MTKQKIAIVGAGISGLTLAHSLSDYAEITIFEKARGVGGRTSTRYAEQYQFDHGAQFFTAKTEEFRNFLKPAIKDGIISPWYAKFVELDKDKIIRTSKWDDEYPHYIPVPKMNQFAKYLASNLNIKLKTRLSNIQKNGNGWKLIADNISIPEEFDWVISTAPPKQTSVLMPKSFKHISIIEKIKMQGCFSLMLGFKFPLDVPWQAALVKNSDIRWISLNSSKPGRPDGFSLLVNADNTWSDMHLEDDIEDITNHLLNEASKILGHDLFSFDHCSVHRWKYANIIRQGNSEPYIDKKNKLAACGDWCIEGRVEAAFTSAVELANEVRKLIC